MGKIPRRAEQVQAGVWGGAGVFRGVAGTGNYDQEQGNKERGMRVQPWVTSNLRVFRRKEPLKKTGGEQIDPMGCLTEVQPFGALWHS